jgi:myo-inositol 2-dehydrogenase/D-chiro-inositol 1-dehydrogenase/scyllo-inositol 2-dehydrogenase (NAD+)
MRFCVIGTGRAGLVHARNLKTRIAGAELAALCDADPNALEQVGRELEVGALYQDYRDALGRDDVDAVVVVTPTFLHGRIAGAAAEAGKHVFLEKPMAVSIDECRQILSAVEKAGVNLQIGFMRRFDARFLEAKRILDSGELGRVMLIKSTGRGPGLPPPWIYDVDSSNGILAEVNSHDFDSVRWLAGSDLTRVYAEAGNFKCPGVKDQYPRFYDNAVVSLRLANGALGTIDGSCPCHYGYDARVEILCDSGMLQIGSAQQHGLTRIHRDGTVTGKTVKSWRNLFRDAYVAELEHFVECIRDDTQPRVTGHDGLKAVEAVVAANESIRKGEPVQIAAKW